MKNIVNAMDALLRRRDDNVQPNPRALLAGAIACYVLYAIASGFFQGGWSIALAVLKVPLIILGSIALCIPSFYVFTALAGVDHSPRAFATALTGFCGVAGLLLVALMPVIWLFSVSTLSLTFVVWLHIVSWLVTLAFARGYLVSAVPRAKSVVGVWLLLLFIVSLQMTTYVRPILWREPGDPLFARGKMSFFTHVSEVVEQDQATERADKSKPPR